MRGHGNVTGADVVMRWSTGYPFGVNLSRGYPRFSPGEFSTIDVLVRGDNDAALILDRDPELESDRGQALRVLLYLFEREAAVRNLRSG